MRSFSPSELLNLWENGLALAPLERGYLLARAAEDDLVQCDLTQMSMGQRDRVLIRMRRRLFGSDVVGIVICPACNGQVELNFSLEEIPLSPPTAKNENLSVTSDTHRVLFRLPLIEDLMFASRQSDEADARQTLISRCIISAQKDGESIETANLPPHVLEDVEREMSDVDPGANIYLAVSCPACNHRWDAAFDIAVHLWREIDTWALRLLREVHLLAKCYGWREADIISLSAQRRSFYLELINQ